MPHSYSACVRRRVCAAFVLVFPVLWPVYANADPATMSVEVALYQPPEAPPNVVPIVRFLGPFYKGSENPDQVISQEVIVNFDESKGELWKSIELKLKDAPLGYNLPEQRIDVPFYAGIDGKKIVVTAIAISPYDDISMSDESKYFRGVNVDIFTQSNPKELFSHYARAARASYFVLENSTDNGSASWEEIQIIYSYLSAASVLARKSFLVENEQLLKALTWLKLREYNIPNSIENSVGLENARYIISKIENMKLNRYKDLWEYLIETERKQSKQSFCAHAGRLQDELMALMPDEARIVNEGNLTPIVSNVFSQCIEDWYYKKDFDYIEFLKPRSIKDALSSQIRILTLQSMGAAKWKSLKSELEERRADLDQILYDITQSDIDVYVENDSPNPKEPLKQDPTTGSLDCIADPLKVAPGTIAHLPSRVLGQPFGPC